MRRAWPALYENDGMDQKKIAAVVGAMSKLPDCFNGRFASLDLRTPPELVLGRWQIVFKFRNRG